MAKGTITISSQAKKMTGTGTAFTDELTTGGFVVFTAGGVVYTLAVLSVESDTELTLVRAYPGPDATGAAWAAIPVGTASNVTMELVAQVTEALRGVNQEKANWQAVFSEDAEITVVLPDQSTFTGPSWLHIVELLKTLDYDRLNGLATQIRDNTAAVEANTKAAATSEANAAASEEAAATSETNAAASEQAAAGSAESAAADAATTGTNALSTAADAAAAAESAKAAAASEHAAETSEANAATSATSATADAKLTAADAKATAADAEATATAAAAAADSAEAAAASKTAAATSERNAGTSEKNAKQYAAEAKEDAEAAAASNPDKCLRIKANLSDVDDKAEALQNLMDKKPLPLASDGAADNHAVTLRQLISATVNGGGDGPTMNGVMNNSLGCVEWFNGTRAKMWPGYLAADGQCLSRAANPEVWAAIAAGIFNAVDESAWSKGVDANGYSNRASYSKGGEEGTCPDKTITDAWFRLPDLNGGQKNSILNGFLRGSAPNNGNVGRTHQDGAPNITGTLSTVIDGVVFLPTTNGAGALGSTGSPDNVLNNVWSGAAWSSHSSGVSIDASRSYSGYGRSTTEIRPAASIGIWIIRVNGIFKAQDTIFNVINADDALPDAGAIVYGGAVQSLYQAAGKDQMFARMRAKYNIDSGHKSALLEIVDNTGDAVTSKTWEFRDDGAFSCPSMTTFRNSIDLGQSSVPWFGSMELRSKTPFIDFHYDNADADYDVRIINDDAGVLSIAHQDGVSTRLRLAGGYQCRQGVRGGFNNNAFNFFWNQQGNLEAWVDTTNVGHVLLNGTSNGQAITVQNKPDGNPSFVSHESNSIINSTGNRTNMFAAIWNNINQYGTIDLFDTTTDIQVRLVSFNTGNVNALWVGATGGTGDSRGGQFAYAASDIALKNRGDNVVQEEAAARIDKLKPCDFEWKRDGRLDRGFIAQEAHKVDKRYAWEADPFWGLSDRAILADAVATIQMMREEMADLKKQLAALKAKA